MLNYQRVSENYSTRCHAKQRGIASKKISASLGSRCLLSTFQPRFLGGGTAPQQFAQNGSMYFLLSAQLCIFTLYQNSDEFCVVILIILIILLGHAVLRLHPVSTVAVCTFDGFSTEKSKSGHCTCGGRKPGTSFLMFYNLGLGGFPTRLCTVCILSSSQPPRLLVVS